MKKLLTTCFALLSAMVLFGQSSAGFWSVSNRSDFQRPAFMPQSCSVLSLDLDAMRSYLRHAPLENTAAAQNEALDLVLPMPDGSQQTFLVWESPIMEPGLAERYPTIKTFAGRSKENPNVRVRFDYSPAGFNAIFDTERGIAHIAPNNTDEQVYLSFYQNEVDFTTAEANEFHCEVKHSAEEVAQFTESFNIGNKDRASVPVDLYTYRLAVATTREYSQDYGNTVTSVMANVVTVVDKINFVFERDAAVRLLLIANTDQVFFFTSPDPYTNGNTQDMIGENPDVLNNAFTVDGYDIGHVFGTNGGGLANLAGVCNGNPIASFPKARAASCKFGPYDGPLFYIVAGHEMGHQFNATHTFNSCDNENETPETGYEPGSGSTIMCYNGNGVCGVNHVQPTSDPFFHVNSMLRMQEFTRVASGSTCKQVVAEGNEMPETTIPIEGGFFIPKSTPFKLTGSASDVNDPTSELTYTWEQYDLGPWSTLGSPIGTAPLFRWYPPSSSTTRIFPKIETIISNTNDIREVLPTTTRELTFRFVARDNHNDAGAFNYDEIKFNSTAAAGPFLVTYPNAAATFAVGENVNVTWDVANTNLAPVNCQKVNLHLSTDGGLTYPTLLVANVDNDGAAYVVMPNLPTTTARIRVEAADNIFFDISNQNFTITAPTGPGFIFTTDPSQGGLACDEISFELNTAAYEGFADQVTFSVVGPPNGMTFSFNPTTVTVGQSSILTINTSGSTTTGLVSVIVQASATGLDDQTRSLELNVVDTDLSGIAASGPADGAAGQSTLPTFAWTDLPNADFYDIELATDPGFTQIIDSETGLTSATYVPTVTLEDGTVYYWRIRATNACNDGDFADPFSFQTAAQICNTKASSGDQNNINIPTAGTPTITSTINFAQGGTISDVNVKKIKGKHSTLRYLEIRLKGPDNTSVVLMSAPSCNGENLDNGFNDESPTSLVNCPTAGVSYKPVGTLANFIGKNSQGDWKLEVAVIDSDGEGGKLENWEMEVCAGLSSANPILITNETLGVPPSATNLIYKNTLEATDADNLPNELEFTIVTNTQHGQVKLNGQALGVGGHFTMWDVYASKVSYTNTDPNALTDYFTFSINDKEGGYFGTPRYNIEIDPNAVIGAAGDKGKGEVAVYPNPATDEVRVMLGNGAGTAISASLMDVQGRSVPMFAKGIGSNNLNLNVTQTAPGLYFLQVKTTEGLFVEKIVIE
ncbi:MAG: T9SS type A sorting domain-containing protein [Saprospiraceae bacterium]|nr:T9SS type A sorting domain-containing protein [Saprospiraceae bacterium]